MELWIKVPNPFWGVETVGFSVRCPAPVDQGPLPDIPFFVEGEAELMAPLGARLRLFPQRDRFVDCSNLGEAYSWTDPINLTDEVIVLAFRDRSLSQVEPDPVAAVRNRLANQLVPLAFPFLRDCVRVAGLRLTPTISVRISARPQPDVELELPLENIVQGNGGRTLGEI